MVGYNVLFMMSNFVHAGQEFGSSGYLFNHVQYLQNVQHLAIVLQNFQKKKNELVIVTRISFATGMYVHETNHWLEPN